jgi:cell wall-associated NlpC family hydrolase
MSMDVASPAPTEVPSHAPTDAPSPAPTEVPPGSTEMPPAPTEVPLGPTEAPSYIPTVPGANAQGSDVATFAMRFVGVPYAWSGADPNGFDCSGFTQYVYRQFGVDLPRVAADQYSDQYGTIVTDPNGLKPGDLIFFANTYEPGITHVGIYIGNGDVVQAMGPGIGVAVGNLREDYWAQHYYGALRPSR